MSDVQRITVAFAASSADEALRLAVEWARAEPRLRLRTVCRVTRPEPPSELYRVELAVVHLDGADLGEGTAEVPA